MIAKIDLFIDTDLAQAQEVIDLIRQFVYG